ncbi:MAG: hypothetical protein KF782_28520 [Labilithrix sp.]|nr:hypothetical protein [Labilithrix sp.]
MRPLLASSACFALGLAAAAPARAADAPAPSSTAPAPPRRTDAVQLDLGLAVVGLAYERLFDPRVALQVEAQIFGTWFGPLVDLPNLRGFGGQVRPTVFLTDDGPRGVYVAPFVRIDRVTAEEDGRSGHGVGFSTGAFVGYSFLLAERLNLRVGAGPQYMSYVVDVGRRRVAFQTMFPALDLVVGYVF